MNSIRRWPLTLVQCLYDQQPRRHHLWLFVTPSTTGHIAERLGGDHTTRGIDVDSLIFSSPSIVVIGPILWGHSGPLCHALSLLSLLLWTSMRRRRATVAACDSSDTWWMAMRRLAVANGPNIFQMLLVLIICRHRCLRNPLSFCIHTPPLNPEAFSDVALCRDRLLVRSWSASEVMRPSRRRNDSYKSRRGRNTIGRPMFSEVGGDASHGSYAWWLQCNQAKDSVLVTARSYTWNSLPQHASSASPACRACLKTYLLSPSFLRFYVLELHWINFIVDWYNTLLSVCRTTNPQYLEPVYDVVNLLYRLSGSMYSLLYRFVVNCGLTVHLYCGLVAHSVVRQIHSKATTDRTRKPSSIEDRGSTNCVSN